MRLKILSFSILFIFSISNIYAKGLGAHVHGSVRLDIAVEKNQLLVLLNTPAESFLGFEYKAKTKKEKDLVKKVKNEWEKNLLSYLGFGAWHGAAEARRTSGFSRMNT